MPVSESLLAARLAIAALIGLGAGLEREWSGHATGPAARFAGLRTFFLLGLIGGIAGIAAAAGSPTVAAAVAAGGAALSVSAYVMAVRRTGADVEGTTEAAALAVVALGVLAGLGWIATAAGAGAVVVLMLREKERLHGFVQHMAEPELRAGLQFAVLAIVVLPLLPAGPFLGALALQPRMLWAIVLVFAGISFVSFVARRTIGPNRGLTVTGALGGLVSSTAVTIGFARQSQREDDALGAPLANGVLAACTVLIPRVIVVSLVLNPAVALELARLLAPPLATGLAAVGLGWRTSTTASDKSAIDESSPLRLGVAIRLALAFQLAMALLTIGRAAWGTPGVYASGAALGLTDTDALTVSMSRVGAGLAADVAARAIAIGVLANTALKLAVAGVLGRATFRRRATIGLASLSLASVIGLLLV